MKVIVFEIFFREYHQSAISPNYLQRVSADETGRQRVEVMWYSDSSDIHTFILYADFV